MPENRDFEIPTSAQCGSAIFTATSEPHGITAAVGRSVMAAADAEDACVIAAGPFSQAEARGEFAKAFSFGLAARAIVHGDHETAVAWGSRCQAHSAGRYGVAIAIADDNEDCIVSAGPEGRLLIIQPEGETQRVFEALVDDLSIFAGRSYTLDAAGKFYEVEAEEDDRDEKEWALAHPPEQLVEALRWAAGC